MNPSKQGYELITQCGHSIYPQSALSDENGNVYIVGTANQTIYEEGSNSEFIKSDALTIALLHDHDLDHFSELAKLNDEACSFGGSWQWSENNCPSRARLL